MGFYNGKVISNITELYSKSEKKTNLYNNPFHNLDEIINNVELDISKKINAIYFSLNVLNMKEVKEYLKFIWPMKVEISAGARTKLTKIVCAIDLFENK